MKTIIKYFISAVFVCFYILLHASTVLEASWKDVVRGNCSDQGSGWWGSSEAIRIAENVLLFQRECGGWPKNTFMQFVLSDKQKDSLLTIKAQNIDCTIDNGAVDYELTYLSKVYGAISDTDMKAKIETGFQLGIQYLLDAQYDNGGWPQFYPYHGGYADYITYNDDAMIHVMYILKHVFTNDGTFSIEVADSTKEQLEAAYNKGIDCILKTQYVQNGLLTVWCAQHDNETLEPAKARSYELASLSGQESAGILSFLMSVNNPSKQVKRAIYSGVKWYEDVKITEQSLEKFTNSDGLSDLRVVDDPNATPMWARFYTLKDNRPFFCDRDGIMKFSLAEIGYERRNGYSWYNTSGNKVASASSNWLPQWGTTILANPFPGQVIYTKDTILVRAFANKYTGNSFFKFELIIDTDKTYTFQGEIIDTVLTGLSAGQHSIVIKSLYENDYYETDSAIFTVSLPVHSLAVYQGTGSGNYTVGTKVIIKANSAPKGMVFDQWTGDTEFVENINDSITTLTIPDKDIRIFAAYKTAPNVGVEENNFEISGNICYPDPVYETLTINLNELGDSYIEIFNVQGKKVYSEMKNKGIHTLQMDFLPQGQYFIHISNYSTGHYSYKILKL